MVLKNQCLTSNNLTIILRNRAHTVSRLAKLYAMKDLDVKKKKYNNK